MGRNASDYTGRLLIVEAPDNDWKNDRMPDEFADLVGVKTKLQILQSDYGSLDQRGMPNVRVLRVHSPVETAQVICRLMHEALRPDDAATPPRPAGRHSPVVRTASLSRCSPSSRADARRPQACPEDL